MTFIFVGTISAYGTGSTSVTVYENGYNDNDDNKRDPSDGRRSLPSAEIIFIDFINNSISGSSIIDEVIEYEIWDESGFSILFATSDERWFVETLASMPKNQGYVLVFKTPYSNYSGSIVTNVCNWSYSI